MPLPVAIFVCLFHLYPPVTRKWRWRYKFWTGPHRSCPFSSFPVVSLTSYHLIFSLFQSYQAKIIIVKPLSKDATTFALVRVESRDRVHTVAVKTAF